MAAPTDEERFRSLYVRRHPAIIAYFTRRIGSQDAADAADDVFTVAWRRFSSVPDGDDALLWLYGVSRNVLSHRRRGVRRYDRFLARLWSVGQPDLLGPEPEVLRGLEGQQVIKALTSLGSDDQELLLLSYWEGLTHNQIGELLDCSKSAVDARVHRALERMRQAMHRSGHKQRRPISETSTVREQS
jgi:RNA polymerase sigma-70 factor (ECF subfamily)